MSVNLLRVASLAATLGLSITAHAGEIIKDRSPDGRFALQLSADEDAFELGLIDLGTHKELVRKMIRMLSQAKQSSRSYSANARSCMAGNGEDLGIIKVIPQRNM